MSSGVRVTANTRPSRANVVTDLLYFNRRTRVFELFFDLCRLLLIDTFLDRFGRRLDQIFGFFQAQTGYGSDFLDDINLLLADRREDYVELGLLRGSFGGRGSCSTSNRRDSDRGSCRYAPFLFEHLRQLRCLNDAQRRQIIDQSCQVSHGYYS